MNRRANFKNFKKTPKLVIFIITLLGWIFIVPLTYIIPRKRNRMILMGTKDGVFIDNIKYFFLYLSEPKAENLDFYLLTANRETYDDLSKNYSNILYYPSFKACWYMLRTNVFVMDSFSWGDNCRFQFFWTAKLVQIWHGIGLKKIQLNNKFFLKELEKFQKRMLVKFVGKLPVYDAIVSTGTFFTEEFFKPAFRSKHFINTGYPRNDVLVDPGKYEAEKKNADCEAIQKLEDFKSNGIKSVLYAPTIRDTGGDAIQDNILDLKILNAFALANNLVIIFKLHPIPLYNYDASGLERIIWYDNVKDVYPLLPLVDVLITDYSSIYLDFILLNRPILFLLYDREKYESKDRELHDYFENFIVGAISRTQKKLEIDILDAIAYPDKQKTKREEILSKSYENIDANSSKRIMNFIDHTYFK